MSVRSLLTQNCHTIAALGTVPRRIHGAVGKGWTAHDDQPRRLGVPPAISRTACGLMTLNVGIPFLLKTAIAVHNT